ncbi:TolB family protein, partial [candidate division KSB1 bacterium]
GKWTEPEVAPFSGKYLDFEPFISPDGKKLLFLSNRPEEGEEEQPGWRKQDIWAVDRTDNEWSEPYNLGVSVNTDNAEFYPAVTRDGTLYFTRVAGGRAAIFRSRYVNGAYTESEMISDKVNSDPQPYNAYISPDEDYLIFCSAGGEDSFGGVDYYIAFRDENDNWSDPVNMGEKINTSANGTSAYVSPDGKYLFFGSSDKSVHEEYEGGNISISDMKKFQNSPRNGNSSIYWIDAGIINDLRNNASENK